jgi:biopolymer transport protein ExbD
MSFPVSKTRSSLRKAKSSRALKGFRPQLTSLVDVMTILLIYLLKSFSSEGEIITVSQELMLPESSAQKQPKVTTVLTVNNRYILAEDVHVANVDEVLASDTLIIPRLYQWLGERRALTTQIERYSTRTKFLGDITIQGDKRIRFQLLKKIMYTCGRQGFNNFSLVVRKREE